MADRLQVAREDIEAFNESDWDHLKELYAPDAVYEEHATGRTLQGPEEIAGANVGWKQAFPDAKGTVTSAAAADDTVTLEVTWEGTQDGPLAADGQEIPPSHNHVVIKAAEVFRFEGDRIKEEHHYFDMLGMMEQLQAK
jgi:steroid delta-isomerase-like uncharacterized protein